MTRPLTISLLALALLLPTFRVQTSFADDAEHQKKILDRKMPEVNFNQISLKDALAFMKDTTAITFNVDWKAFKKQKVTEASVVSRNIKDLTIAEAVRQIFVAAGATADPVLKVTNTKTVSVKPGQEAATTEPTAPQ